MMTTQAEYAAQCRVANPKPQYAIMNGVQVLLTDDEYEAALEAWAIMRVEQNKAHEETLAEMAIKKAAYTKLGLTETEIAAILNV